MQCHLPQYSTAEKMGVSAPSQHFARQKAQEAIKAHDFQTVFQSKRARKVLQALNPSSQTKPSRLNKFYQRSVTSTALHIWFEPVLAGI